MQSCWVAMALRIPGPAWFWTSLELLSMIVLLHSQGLTPRQVCPEMGRRLRSRLRAPQLVSGLLAAWTAGSASLLAFGVGSGLMCLSSIWGARSVLMVARELACFLLAPGLIEEIVFRVLLLPLKQQDPPSDPLLILQQERQLAKGEGLCRWPRPWSRQEAATLAIFLLYHLDACHVGPMRPIFTDVRFLAMAGMLGAACTDAVHLSGSVWPGVLMHGTWVWSWLAFARC